MTRITDRHGYTRPLPARLWLCRLRLAPRWAWEWHRGAVLLAAAAAVLLAAALISVQGIAGAGAFLLLAAACMVVWGAGAAIILTVRYFRRR